MAERIDPPVEIQDQELGLPDWPRLGFRLVEKEIDGVRFS